MRLKAGLSFHLCLTNLKLIVRSVVSIAVCGSRQTLSKIILSGSKHVIKIPVWRKIAAYTSRLHVYADLQAYICTHNHCKYSLKTFPSRNLWADHEFSEHFSQKKWHCLSCDIEIFKKQDFIEHLTSRHDRNPNFRLLQAALSEAEERSLTTDFEKHPCPLCLQSNWATKVAYASHVGRHLEEISLAALPGTTDGGSGSEESSNKGPMTSNIEGESGINTYFWWHLRILISATSMPSNKTFHSDASWAQGALANTKPSTGWIRQNSTNDQNK